MQFNNGTTTQSMVARMNRIAGTTNVTYPLVDKASDSNEALDRYWFLALTADGKWQLDDINNTDLPSARAQINSGQQDYGLSTDMLEVDKVLVKDSAGIWTELTPIDIRQSRSNIHAQNIIELPSGNSGVPTHYDISGNSLFLDPVPNYTQAASLRVIFKRGANYFISTDTSKQPGIPSIHHPYIVRRAAWTFLNDKNPVKADKLFASIQQEEDAIQEFFSKRNSNEPTKVIPARRRIR
jgi:hypothetical protein